MTKYVALYERISTKDKQDLQMQHLQLQRWCKSNGIPCSRYKWYRDKASAKDVANRAGLQKVIKDVERGKISTVVVYSLSRLSRDVASGIQVLQSLCRHKVRVVSLSEQLDITSTFGELVSNILLAIYQFDRKQRNQMISHGISAARRKNGGYWGRPRNDKRLNQIRKLFDDGVTAIDIAQRLGCSRANIYNSLAKTQ